MNKKNIFRIILIVLIMLNCFMIFNFSSEKSEDSDITSGRVINRIIEVNPFTKNLEETKKEKIREVMVYPIRKSAHFTIYLCLGILVFLFCETFTIENYKKILASLMFSFIYACTDEIHQLFVPGRSGEIGDVFIDTSGALLGIMIVYTIYKILKRKNRL